MQRRLSLSRQVTARSQFVGNGCGDLLCCRKEEFFEFGAVPDYNVSVVDLLTELFLSIDREERLEMDDWDQRLAVC